LKLDLLKQKTIELFGVKEDSVTVEEEGICVAESGVSIEFAIPKGLDLDGKDMTDLLVGKEIPIKKVYSELESEIDVKEENGARIINMVGSAQSEDRLGDIINQDGWELANYKKNPVVLWGHQYRTPAIARSRETKVENKKLVFLLDFPPEGVYELSDLVFNLYKYKILRASSVGFLPKDYKFRKDDKGIHFLVQELLELSCVNVPAHPAALAASYGKGTEFDPLTYQKVFEPLAKSFGESLQEARKAVGELNSLLDEARNQLYSFEVERKLKQISQIIKEGTPWETKQ